MSCCTWDLSSSSSKSSGASVAPIVGEGSGLGGSLCFSYFHSEIDGWDTQESLPSAPPVLQIKSSVLRTRLNTHRRLLRQYPHWSQCGDEANVAKGSFSTPESVTDTGKTQEWQNQSGPERRWCWCLTCKEQQLAKHHSGRNSTLSSTLLEVFLLSQLPLVKVCLHVFFSPQVELLVMSPWIQCYSLPSMPLPMLQL